MWICPCGGTERRMNRDGREELLSIEGTIEKLIYQNEENGYTVCELMAPSDECFVLVGMMPYLCEGESISALGNWTTHPSFGRQFRVEFYEKQLPATATAILKYLSSGAIKGIGPMTAKKIVEQYGDDTLDVLEPSSGVAFGCPRHFPPEGGGNRRNFPHTVRNAECHVVLQRIFKSVCGGQGL